MALTSEKKARLNRMNSVSKKAGLGDLLAYAPIYAGLKTTAGGSATEVFTISGIAVGDICSVDVNTNGATPRTVVTSKVTATNTLTVVFSGDPSTDHVVNVIICRAV